jgi:hypothetical protein
MNDTRHNSDDDICEPSGTHDTRSPLVGCRPKPDRRKVNTPCAVDRRNRPAASVRPPKRNPTKLDLSAYVSAAC